MPTAPSADWPWLDDRREITRVALYVQCAFEETVRALGEEWARTEAELGCLLQWCAGRSTDANVVGAERRLSGFLARRWRVTDALDLHSDAAIVDTNTVALPTEFAGYKIAQAARWACGAVALPRVSANALARYRAGSWTRSVPPQDGPAVTSAIDVRRKLFLAEAVACATCAVAYVATDPRTVAVDLWQRTERLWSQDAALALLDGCETARSRVPTRDPNPTRPVTPPTAEDPGGADQGPAPLRLAGAPVSPEVIAQIADLNRRVQVLDAASRDALNIQAAADLTSAPGGDEAIRVIASVYAKRLTEAYKTAAPRTPPLTQPQAPDEATDDATDDATEAP